MDQCLFVKSKLWAKFHGGYLNDKLYAFLTSFFQIHLFVQKRHPYFFASVNSVHATETKHRKLSCEGPLFYNNWRLKWSWLNFNRVLQGIPSPPVPRLKDQREFSSMVSLSLSLLSILSLFLPPLLFPSSTPLVLNSQFQSLSSSWAFVSLLIQVSPTFCCFLSLPSPSALWNLY